MVLRSSLGSLLRVSAISRLSAMYLFSMSGFIEGRFWWGLAIGSFVTCTLEDNIEHQHLPAFLEEFM